MKIAIEFNNNKLIVFEVKYAIAKCVEKLLTGLENITYYEMEQNDDGSYYL